MFIIHTLSSITNHFYILEQPFPPNKQCFSLIVGNLKHLSLESYLWWFDGCYCDAALARVTNGGPGRRSAEVSPLTKQIFYLSRCGG